MAKLTRIVKKILLKDAPEHDVRKQEATSVPSVESFATRGLPQPTVDFSNLPIIDDEELRQRAAEKARLKSLTKVSRKGSTIAKARPSASRIKSKVVLPKVKGRKGLHNLLLSPEPEPVETATASKADAKVKPSKPAPVSTTVNTKVIKPQSRGKRRREATKEMWRRKYDFANEAKRLVEAYHQEDHHGIALGNISDLKGEISSLEAMLTSISSSDRTAPKPSSKRLLRAKLRNRALLQAALNNS
ncbi:bifunctional (p)ppGpp synthase hydrolase, putative [Babesia ovis]|uniref:Bifunctional (P)ppGpp synthase hydrolase, putative n=1 Tax=Babesia ovis TaxID=5869 RepID=A0A9W5TAT0_BABOV|nr:bifunctional (p)ppGpp synthase hydrolase, putative [Babesia ovis]